MAGLREFVVQFGTEEQCIEHLAGLRWPAAGQRSRRNARYTAPGSETAPQTLAAQPLIPPLIDWAMLP